MVLSENGHSLCKYGCGKHVHHRSITLQVGCHSWSGKWQPEASVFPDTCIEQAEDSSLILDAIALLGSIMQSIKSN